MVAYIVRRLLQSAVVMMVVGFIAFSMFQYVGDPIEAMVGRETSQAQRDRLRQELGLNDPAVLQFARFMRNAAVGEFGLSYYQKRPVSDMFAERIPATLELTLASGFIALLLGVTIGVYSGLRPDTWLSKLFQTVSLIGISLPPFLVGILLIFAFAVILGWLPSSGRGEVVSIGWWTTGFATESGLKALILPSITLALFQMTLIMRLVRAEMVEVLRTDYIKFARARGLKRRSINFGHALKNTLVPVITVVGLQLGSIIAFAIIIETVFQWPGMGFLFLQAVVNVDIPVMSAYLVLVSLMFVILNLVIDLLYYAIDPRLRMDRAVGAGHPG